VTIDAHIAAVSAQATQPYQTPRQRHETWKAQVRESVADAERAQKTARQEARWAKQEERDAKLRTWFEGKTDAEVSAYLASEGFDRLSDRQRAVIHGVLDEIREGNEAEVDFNLRLADEQQAEAEFSFPADPLPWEERPEQGDDEVEDAWDDDDDDPGLTGENYTERS
jgi:phage protein D